MHALSQDAVLDPGSHLGKGRSGKQFDFPKVV